MRETGLVDYVDYVDYVEGERRIEEQDRQAAVQICTAMKESDTFKQTP